MANLKTFLLLLLGLGVVAGQLFQGARHRKSKRGQSSFGLGFSGLSGGYGQGFSDHEYGYGGYHPNGIYDSGYDHGHGYGQDYGYGIIPRRGFNLGYQLGYQGRHGFIQLKRNNQRQFEVAVGLGKQKRHGRFH